MSAFVTHHWILSAPVHVFPFVSWLDICSISSLITFMTMSLSFYFPSWYLFASKTRKTTIRSVGSFVSSNDGTFIPEFCISFFLDCLFVWMLRLDGCCLVSSRDCVWNFRNKACVFGVWNTSFRNGSAANWFHGDDRNVSYVLYEIVWVGSDLALLLFDFGFKLTNFMFAK